MSHHQQQPYTQMQQGGVQMGPQHQGVDTSSPYSNPYGNNAITPQQGQSHSGQSPPVASGYSSSAASSSVAGGSYVPPNNTASGMGSSHRHHHHHSNSMTSPRQYAGGGDGGGGAHASSHEPSSQPKSEVVVALSGLKRNVYDPARSCIRSVCGCKYDPLYERLEYNYDYDEAQHDGKPQPMPRVRERGEPYVDSFNGEPWACSFGTSEESGIWMNSGDQAGSIMAALVWVLMIYSAVTVTLLTITEGINPTLGMAYCVLCALALSCHAKTSLTDPGSVPRTAVPQESQRRDSTSHSMCGQCQTFKPPMSHHCRICNRCVSRMDHHCPWMNNCVGAANLKHFLLFLLYTWTCAAYSLTLFGWNYFFCSDEDCTFNNVVVHLVRVMTVLCIGAFLFTSSMLMNVCYGLMTGIGTIDRLKKKATNTMSQSDEEPIPLKDVFGIAGYHTWPFPVDPVFDDYDRVMGYSTPQRLVREQELMQQKRPSNQLDIEPSPTIELPACVNDFLPV